MNVSDIYNNYVFSDGDILSFRLDYETKQFMVGLKVRRLVTNQKFETCKVELEFTGVSEINIFEDFPTNGGCTDVTLVKLDSGDFYLSLDPYGNSGMPHDEDNFIIKADALTLIDEKGVRKDIS